MNKHRITKKARNRILAAATSLALLLTTVPSFTLNANAEAGEASEDRRADGSTVNSYQSILNAGSTLDAGRIWTDKSVYALNDDFNGIYNLDVDVTDMTSDPTADFLEVFSALGSSTAITGAFPVMDVMFVLDMSGSMGCLENGSDNGDDYTQTRLYRAIEALNNAFDYVQGQNELNRVGLTIYSGEGPYGKDSWNTFLGQDKTDASNGRVVLGLGQYTTNNKTNDGKNEYFTVYGSANPASNKVIGKVGQVCMSVNVNEGTLIEGEKTHDSRQNIIHTDNDACAYLKDNIRAAGATNTQMGLYTAMNVMANEPKTSITVDGEAVTRLPIVILVTDGAPTISDTGDWWAPSGIGSQGTGDEPYAYGNGMLAMATASYMKREINKNYYGDPDPALGYSALIYTFGISITDDREVEMANAFLNPKENFGSDTDIATDIRKAWQAYQDKQNTGTPQISIEVENKNGVYVSVKDYTFTHPTAGYEDIDNLIYNDRYRLVSSNDLEEALQEALESVQKIPVPIDGTNELAKQDMLSYYDPIGEYMEIKVNDEGLLGKLSLFNKTYKVVKDGEDSYKVVDPEGDVDDEIPNLSYGNDSDVTFKLSDIKIWVENKTDGNREYQVLRVDIPAAALPTLTSTVALKFDPVISKDEAEIVVEDYTTNHVDPLRLFYTVGMQDEYLKEDGSIDLNKISPEYRAQHLDLDTGRVSFYSNLYSSDDYEYIGGAESEQRGDAYTTFSPADTNRYYIYQEYLPLYTVKGNKESSYVTTYKDVADTYYFDFKYYTINKEVKTETIERTGSMFGSGVPGDSEYGDFLVWYNLNNGKVADFAKEVPEDGRWVVAAKAGGILVGDMNHLADLKTDNTTGTSGTFG